MAKAYFKANSRKILDRQKKYQFRKLSPYGLKKQDFKQMYADQDGLCAICKNRPKTLCVDHDHETNLVRELLCVTCNSAIGMLKDDPEIIRSAALYIEKWRKAQESHLFTTDSAVATV